MFSDIDKLLNCCNFSHNWAPRKQNQAKKLHMKIQRNICNFPFFILGEKSMSTIVRQEYLTSNFRFFWIGHRRIFEVEVNWNGLFWAQLINLFENNAGRKQKWARNMPLTIVQPPFTWNPSSIHRLNYNIYHGGFQPFPFCVLYC